MKRSAELTPLSHDHHKSLFVALQLKRATEEAAGEAFTEFLAEKGEDHFRAEESILLPAWIAADPDADPAMANRVLAEHLELRAAGRRLDVEGLSVEELRRVGELLEAHVRFEERELFPLIEERLEEGALRALGEELATAERGP